MSITVRKREEPRNTSRKDFLLAAALPLLIALLGGFALGRAGADYSQNWNSAYHIAETDKAQLEASLREVTVMTKTLDSLREVFDEQYNEIEDGISDVYPSGDEGRWEREKSRLFKYWETEIGKLEGQLTGDPTLMDIIRHQIIGFDEYRMSKNEVLVEKLQVAGYEANIAGDQLRDMEIERLEEEIDGLKHDKRVLEIKSISKGGQSDAAVEEATASYTEAMNKLEASKNTVKNYKKRLDDIQGEVNKIRKEILPQLTVSAISISQRQRIEALNKSLSQSMNTIDGLTPK